MRARRVTVLVALGLALAFSGGCAHRLRTTLLPNQRPVVRLSRAPAPTGSPTWYSYQVEWTGYDPDGTITQFLYCVDPPTTLCTDTPWVATLETRRTLSFPCSDPDSAGTPARPGGFHVLVVKAVDDHGAQSEPAVDAFFSYTVAPTVQILQPLRVRALIDPELPPTTTFVWTGTDPDGQHGHFPVRYKYRIFPRSGSEFDWVTLQTHPDIVRQAYAPEFAGWDTVSGDTCRVTVENLTPGASAVLAVVAFDEAGAYSPVFSYAGNMLRFTCSYLGNSGPRLSVWNEYFRYDFAGAAYSLDPTTFLHIEVPADRPVYFSWHATPHTGSVILGYRWAMDLATIDDPAPRTDETSDWTHWSALNGSSTSARVGPFPGTGPDSLEQHIFYVEAEDANHLKSLAVVQFRVLRDTGERELLVVDDTRFEVGRTSNVYPDSLLPPTALWPSVAELDTFLFARGGVRWRFYPPGTLSPPGILAGYDFDTLSTRAAAMAGVPLSVLARYRRVIWLCDPAEEYRSSFDTPRFPMPLLRMMSGPAQFNSLTAFAGMGGGTWMMGGGIAYNSLLPWNVASNDVNSRYPYTARSGMVYSAAAGELVAGRVMYHTAHWRSSIREYSPMRATIHPAFAGSPLPAELREKTVATDPLPPLRRYASQFYLTSYPGETLNLPNVVADLDTLYFATGGDMQGAVLPVMTLYHGPDSGPCIFSGFPLWYFQRGQAIQVADHVLQRIWGLPRRAVPR